VIPYEPFPERWTDRYNAMLKAREDYGLCGIMESHHYGYWPSFISKIEKLMFTQPLVADAEAIRAVACEYYGQQNAEAAIDAWHTISEALKYYPCSAENQYGPFRIGPAYPLVFRYDVQIPTVPYAHFGGNTICFPDYASDGMYKISNGTTKIGLIQQRIPGEIKAMQTMHALLKEGHEKLEKLNDRLTGVRLADNLRLINMLKFMENTVITAIHVQQFYRQKCLMRTQTEVDQLEATIKEMIRIGEAEIANAEATIPLVEADSRLGWEPSMEYIGDARHLRWKIKQTKQVIESELPPYLDHIRRQTGTIEDAENYMDPIYLL